MNEIEKNSDTVEILKRIGYSDKAIMISFMKLNFGKMSDPNIIAEHQSDCGDILILYLKINNNTIITATYEYIGCIGLQVAASALTELVKNTTVENALSIGFKDIYDYLEGVPDSKHDCIELAISTLKKGLEKSISE
jgi:nitrogen fixation NifU-like protein